MHLSLKDLLISLMVAWTGPNSSDPQWTREQTSVSMLLVYLKSPLLNSKSFTLISSRVFSFPVKTSNFSYSKEAELSQQMVWTAATHIPWAVTVGWHTQNCSLLTILPFPKSHKLKSIYHIVYLTGQAVWPSLFSHFTTREFTGPWKYSP